MARVEGGITPLKLALVLVLTVGMIVGCVVILRPWGLAFAVGLPALADRFPETKDQLFSPEGELNRYVNIYLNDEDVRVLDGLDTGASDSDTVVILPAMAGGAASVSPRSRPSSSRRPSTRAWDRCPA